MSRFIENISDCYIDERLELKLEFAIVTNFSFTLEEVNERLRAGSSSVAMNEIRDQKIFIEFDDFFIDKTLLIQSISMSEAARDEAIFEIEVRLKYKVNEKQTADLKVDGLNKEIRSSIQVSDEIKKFIDSLKNFFILKGWSFFLLPDYPQKISVFNYKKNIWEQLSQIGIPLTIQNMAFKKEQFKDFLLEKLPYEFNGNNILNNKKVKNCLNLIDAALRFQKNNLFLDAYLNFYKVVEILFKENKVIEHIFKVLEKPSEYVNIYKQCNQKILMTILFEFFNKIEQPEQQRQANLQLFINLAEIRNNLAHSSDVSFNHGDLEVIKNISLNLLNKYIELLKAD